MCIRHRYIFAAADLTHILAAPFSSGVECVDWTGGQIKNNDSSDDVKNVDLSQVHYLSGPITVEGAQPGDLLKVEFLNLGALDDDEWGFTGTFAKENGGGFLTDHFPKATKACLDIDGIYCSR